MKTYIRKLWYIDNRVFWENFIAFNYVRRETFKVN